MQYETWLTLSNPGDDVVRTTNAGALCCARHVTLLSTRHLPQIAFKIKLNKSKRYMVKPYQGVIMGGKQSVVRRKLRPQAASTDPQSSLFAVVVRGEQFTLLMAKLQRSMPDESTAVDGYVAWDIDDKFQVQRAVLPVSLRGRLPSEEEMSSAPKEATNTITSVVADLWTSVNKQSVSSSVLLSRFMVPIGVLRRLTTDPPESIVPADMGEEVQAAAAAAAQHAHDDVSDTHSLGVGPSAASAAGGGDAAAEASAAAAAAQEQLLELRSLYNSVMREQSHQQAARSNLEEGLRARDAKIVQLERAAADLKAQVEGANARVAALEIDGADVHSGGEDSPASGLRNRGKGGSGGDAVGVGGGDGTAPPGFALWQLALVAIIMFLVGRIV